MKINCITDIFVEIPFDSLSGISFEKLNLHRALLENANMSNSSFSDIDFRGAFLNRANLERCIFIRVNFITAFLIGSKLLNVRMQECTAMYANFESSDLRFADLRDLDVKGANFKYCNLKGANMMCFNLEFAELSGAVYDLDTLWPEFFDPKKAGCLSS